MYLLLWGLAFTLLPTTLAPARHPATPERRAAPQDRAARKNLTCMLHVQLQNVQSAHCARIKVAMTDVL